MPKSKRVTAPRWIESDGGPLVVVNVGDLSLWQGVDAPSDGRVVQATFRFDDPASPATDYDSACDATASPRFFGRVARKDIDVLALNRGPKCWRPLRDGAVIVAWESGPSEKSVNAHLKVGFPDAADAEPSLQWTSTDVAFRVTGSAVAIFDSAYPGRERTSATRLEVPLVPGRYLVHETEWAPDAETLLTLYALRRASGRA